MFFNFGKCKHVHHGSQDLNFRYSMSNNGEIKEIQKVTSEKDLRVIVDNKLLFRKHIGKKVGIANRNLGLIFKTFESMDKDMFLSLSLRHYFTRKCSAMCNPLSRLCQTPWLCR